MSAITAATIVSKIRTLKPTGIRFDVLEQFVQHIMDQIAGTTPGTPCPSGIHPKFVTYYRAVVEEVIDDGKIKTAEAEKLIEHLPPACRVPGAVMKIARKVPWGYLLAVLITAVVVASVTFYWAGAKQQKAADDIRLQRYVDTATKMNAAQAAVIEELSKAIDSPDANVRAAAKAKAAADMKKANDNVPAEFKE